MLGGMFALPVILKDRVNDITSASLLAVFPSPEEGLSEFNRFIVGISGKSLKVVGDPVVVAMTPVTKITHWAPFGDEAVQNFNKVI